jgi:hypothetical protein
VGADRSREEREVSQISEADEHEQTLMSGVGIASEDRQPGSRSPKRKLLPLGRHGGLCPSGVLGQAAHSEQTPKLVLQPCPSSLCPLTAGSE